MTPGFVDAPWGENIYFLKGECLLGQKDYKGAIEQFDNYINSETDESWVDVYTFLYKGICLLKLGRSSKAEEQFEKMLTYYPNRQMLLITKPWPLRAGQHRNLRVIDICKEKFRLSARGYL